MRRINLLIIAKLSDEKITSKIAPLINSELVSSIYLARVKPLNIAGVVDVCPPSVFRKIAIVSEIYRFLQCIWLLCTKPVDIVMGIQMIPHGYYAGMLGLFFHKKVIQNIIESEEKIRSNYLSNTLLRRAQAVVVRGDFTKQVLLEDPTIPGRIYHIPNFLNFENIPKPTKLINKKYDLIFIGSLTTSKRVDLFIELVGILNDFHNLPSIKAVILGDGVMTDFAMQLIKKKNLENNIELYGYTPNVYPFLAESKVYALTSQYEGLPMSLIEAMSMGIPCVCFDISNIGTIVKNGENSFLCKYPDLRDFANNIYNLLKDEDLYNRMSAEAMKIRTEKKEEYSMSSIQKLWENLLKDLVD
ncbi:MAG: hypothetical protein ACD_22C00136G0008 [uncultured bacterium]|nr:MAG: hypothetical protein ACD_22C00136G0008 [uncultured bacterium]